jgi:hypothetical protein
VSLRERVCEECNWSVPTFYRKARLKDKEEDGQVVYALSNAERAMIVKVLKEVFAALEEELEPYK